MNKTCKEGKDYNPTSKRCVLKCRTGKIRDNSTFKCRNPLKITNTNIRKLVSLYIANSTLPSELQNVPINDWDVSNVTNMSNLFASNTRFNEPLNKWNVGKVTNMEGMFSSCARFNQPLNNWNVSKVKNMKEMFAGCQYFNQPLNNWNVGKVTNMEAMFLNCADFNQPLNNWNVKKVKNMKDMFSDSAMQPHNYPATNRGGSTRRRHSAGRNGTRRNK